MWKNSTGYPPKVLAIYEAVVRLLKEGRDINTLKVADIAKEAGIGKGTAYEYFNSKEEILAKSLIFTLRTAVGDILNGLEKANSLKGCLSAFAKCLQNNQGIQLTLDFVEKLVNNSPGMQMSLKEELMREIRENDYILNIVRICVRAGLEDGSIPEQADMDYVEFVVESALTILFSNFNRCGQFGENRLSQEQIFEYTCQMIEASFKK